MNLPDRVWINEKWEAYLRPTFDGDNSGYIRRDPAVLAELPEVRALAERAANEVLTEYRDSQEQMWTFRQEHIHNAIARVFAAAIKEGRK